MTTDLPTLITENRRPRAILDGIARAGLGQGALVEVPVVDERIRLLVCRADVNEDAFLAQLKESLLDLGEALGAIREVVEVRHTGVTADDPNQGPQGGGAP